MRKLCVCTLLCAGVFSAACSVTKSSPTAPTSQLLTAAAPTPDPNPPSSDGCVSNDALTILTCERNKFDHMTADQENAFIKASAVALRNNNIPGAPFGILHKTSGSNCNGYACDILCAGEGESQLQWDVLADGDPWPNGGAQVPQWGSPAGYPNIRVDVCDLQ